MSIKELLLGPPLPNQAEPEHRVTAWGGLPMLGLDALGSAAYGPEAAMTILIPLGAVALTEIGPIAVAILAILGILYFSYRQTIHAYPTGGGAYTVATKNLGRMPGLIAAAALLIDYILNVAVGISAGVGALISALPALHPYTLSICLGILLLIAVVNLRGVRESGIAFSVPTYVFVATMIGAIAIGVGKTLTSGGHPHPVVAPPPPGPPLAAISLWLVLRAFSSGCTAMTGVEAVSNGVSAFKDPGIKYARRTLTAIVAILAVLLAGIAFLIPAYHVAAMLQERSGYQSLISQLVGAIAGRGVFYYVTIGSVLSVLALSANTSFAGFPRLCRLLAEDGYLPHSFRERGSRLVYTRGIITLTLFSGVLLVIFGGVTDRLIPLFAVGAFAAFTLSQAGMVSHWWRNRERGWLHSMLLNGFGATATGGALVVVLVTKFTEGAWITILVIPATVLLFTRVCSHYRLVKSTTKRHRPIDLTPPEPPNVIVPIQGWDTVAEKALRFALQVSPNVSAVCVSGNEAEGRHLLNAWNRFVRQPLEKEGRPIPRLIILHSPVRRVTAPILDFIRKAAESASDRTTLVIIPELVEGRWYHYFLHNQRAAWLKAKLFLTGSKRLIVANVPWYLESKD